MIGRVTTGNSLTWSYLIPRGWSITLLFHKKLMLNLTNLGVLIKTWVIGH